MSQKGRPIKEGSARQARLAARAARVAANGGVIKRGRPRCGSQTKGRANRSDSRGVSLKWPGGGTGRHAGLKILLPGTAVRVRFPPRLPSQVGVMREGPKSI